MASPTNSNMRASLLFNRGKGAQRPPTDHAGNLAKAIHPGIPARAPAHAPISIKAFNPNATRNLVQRPGGQ